MKFVVLACVCEKTKQIARGESEDSSGSLSQLFEFSLSDP